jgi:adenylate cyclase
MTSGAEPVDAPSLVFDEPGVPRVVTLSQGQFWTLGRAPDNQIVIDDTSISRKHAMLQRLENGHIFLVDLGSSNGTFVNERRVSVPVTLRPDDRITFGATRCRFTVPDEVPRTAPETLAPVQTATRILQVRRLLTVVVVDIRDFTALTRQISDQTLSAVMSHWFQLTSRITQRSGGWVDKYIGDAVMAIWAHANDEAPASQAGPWLWALSEMASRTSRVHERFALPGPLRVGAGVNTGFAVMSNSGPRDHPDYTAFGDTVNATFRLEAATRAISRDVLLGDASWRSLEALGVGGAFTSVSVSLKGYDQPVVAYAGDFAAVSAIAAQVGVPGPLTREHERR